ncbi:MAG: phytoene/squalene synthase family protein [Bacteroidetes bacterium]|nr:phytoene/squalene synthase family protein [Bacteroidota bacterium]MCW5894439.1 phytoene/squalene synthase family protein [Bacteroidota bacterium]
MIGFLDIQELHENYRQCRLYTRHYAKTFYFASHMLPREKRLAAYAVYSFCRYADEIADHGAAMGNHVRARRRLDDLRNQLKYVYNNSPAMDAKLLAFRDTVFRYAIPQDYFMDLLRGVEMDLEKKRFADFSELNDYCYCVASVVGLMMTKIFGVSDDSALRHAADLGTAMQLTNILRDVGEDYRRGRIYLPQDELATFGYSERELKDGVVNRNFKRLMEFQIDRARRYYESAEQGIPLLTNDGSRFCVRLMSTTYATILPKIEKNSFNVFTLRASVPFAQKLGIALFAAAGFSRKHQSAGRTNLEPFSPIPAEQM